MTTDAPLCIHCGEPVEGSADYILCVDTDGTRPRARHRECSIRAAVGGINHQLGLCTCCPGGTEPPDPPWLSPREAAIAAVAHWRLTDPSFGTGSDDT